MQILYEWGPLIILITVLITLVVLTVNQQDDFMEGFLAVCDIYEGEIINTFQTSFTNDYVVQLTTGKTVMCLCDYDRHLNVGDTVQVCFHGHDAFLLEEILEMKRYRCILENRSLIQTEE